MLTMVYQSAGLRRLRVPPHAYFLVSATFHYLGPAFAVLLFQQVDVLGVAWLRIAAAATVFAVWRRPWNMARGLTGAEWANLAALGVVLAAMNACFYVAIARLPLGTVGGIEFLGPVALAALGLHTRRNLAALALAVIGVYMLTDVRLAGEPIGFAFAFANCALFVLYVVLGHRVSRAENRVDCLGLAMLIALLAITPVGLLGAAPALTSLVLVGAGIGVGVCSSVIPYVFDQLAMARLPRATFALLLSLLPASAAIIGLIILAQVPTLLEAAAIALIIGGVALHREAY